MAEIEATDADREVFRDRVKGAISRAGTSGRAVEEALDLVKGTLTRLYNGRRQPDESLVRRLGEHLGIPPEDLVEGTGFGVLLSPASGKVDPLPADEVARSEGGEAVDTQGVDAEPEADRVDPAPTVASSVSPSEVADANARGAEDAVSSRPVPPTSSSADTAREDAPPKRRKRGILLVPIRAAITFAGGLARVGGTVVALLRRGT